MQPGDRGVGQRASRPRDRCARRHHGAGDRPRRHPVPHAQSQQGRGGARAARPSRPQALPPGGAESAGGAERARDPRRRRRGSSARRGGRGGRGGASRWQPRHGGTGGAHHRDLPARRHPSRRAPDPRRPRRRGAIARPVADAVARRFRARPAEDRHAAAARRADDRSDRARGPAGRRPASAFFLPDQCDNDAADTLPHHRDDAGEPRADHRQSASLADVFRPDRGHRAALLPVDRGGRAMPSNTITSIRASCGRRWRRAASPVFTSPDRSTARPATRRRPGRGWSPGSMPRSRPGAAASSCSTAPTPISAC